MGKESIPCALEQTREQDHPRVLCGAGGRNRPSTAEVIMRLLAQRPVDRLPMVRHLPRLANQHGALRLGRACRPASAPVEEYTGQTIRCILEKGLDMAVLPPMTTAWLPAPQFARSAEELLPGLEAVS